MTAPNRTSQFKQLHKILKRHYKAWSPDANRGVLEHLLFACCAENAHYDAAEEAYAALVHNFYDWNEVRVSSVRELAEVMHGLPDPPAAAYRVKQVLQSVFETTYEFGLEDLRKLNLGPASERLAKFSGTTTYSVAFAVQAALGGHAIPVDASTLGALRAVQLVGDDDVKAGTVPGMERAVAKSKGFEFASLLHQVGADYMVNPHAPALKAILTEVDPEAAERLPRQHADRVDETPVERRRRRAATKRARAAKAAEYLDQAAEEEATTKKKTKSPKHPARAEKKTAATDETKPTAREKKSAPAKKKSSDKKKTDGASASDVPSEKKKVPHSTKRKPR